MPRRTHLADAMAGVDAGTPADLPPGWLRPVFAAPNVRALMTARAGGISRPPFDSMNLRAEVGDDPAAVAENRRRLAQRAGVPLLRLDQVHGIAVARLTAGLMATGSAAAAAPVAQADASYTLEAGLACEIQVADCLPVLLADRQGRCVAAAHAGWRGLSSGVLEATVAVLCREAGLAPRELQVWLGPCIGPSACEVGDEVRAAFMAQRPSAARHFRPRPAAGKWLADLPGLARDRLGAVGVHDIGGNDGSPAWCTVSDASRFFSFRRDRDTGRMAACIWRVA